MSVSGPSIINILCLDTAGDSFLTGANGGGLAGAIVVYLALVSDCIPDLAGVSCSN